MQKNTGMQRDQIETENRIYIKGQAKIKKKRKNCEGLHFYASYTLLVSQAIWNCFNPTNKKD